MKKHSKHFVLCCTAVTILLGGCRFIESRLSPPEVISSTAIVSESNENSREATATSEIIMQDSTLPTFDEVESALFEDSRLTLGQAFFKTTQHIHHQQQQFDVAVNEMRVYSVKKHDDELASEFNFETQSGALIAMKVSITNESDQAFYFPIEELRLSFDNATLNTSASTTLYPTLPGNLMAQFLETEGLVEGGQTIDGYLIYGVGAQAFQNMQREHYFYLTVVPPRATLEELIGADGNPLGDTVNLFLPLSQQVARILSQNSEYIQDRLTTEWWGNKDVLATKELERTQTSRNVDVTLKKVELSDFTPREAYLESFQNFIYGQIIVSVEYEVHNRSRENVLPIDGGATLTIGEDPIQSDYVLINQKYGQEVKPNETYRVIKTFALDKQRYIDYWQGKDIEIMLEIPQSSDVISSDNLNEETEEASTTRRTLTVRTYSFHWSPEVTTLLSPKPE